LAGPGSRQPRSWLHGMSGSAPEVLCHFLGRNVSADELECCYHHLDQAVSELRAFSGVADMLDLLRRSRYKLGVYTAATRRAAAAMLDVAGLREFFAVLVGGDEVSQPKPAAEGLLLACDRLRVSPAEIAYIGDTDLDLICARNAGALGIQASRSGTGNLAPGFTTLCAVSRRGSETAATFLGLRSRGLVRRGRGEESPRGRRSPLWGQVRWGADRSATPPSPGPSPRCRRARRPG
jgi:HAD superfamily hydrolase (TIGR01549 family)